MSEAGIKYGFLYEPGSEAEVCILFGILMPNIGEELGATSEYYIDEWTEKPTDLILRADGKPLRVEFELYSNNFRTQGHDPNECDLIICWRKDWNPAGRVKVLELSEVIKRRYPNLVLNALPKYPERVKPWSLEEFMTKLRDKVSAGEYQKLQEFVEELKTTKGIELVLGRGHKVPTLGIYIERLGNAPLGIEATGRATMAYYNVNMKPPKPNFSEDKISEMRRFLGEPKKKWHYIKASNITALVSKLRAVVDKLSKD